MSSVSLHNNRGQNSTKIVKLKAEDIKVKSIKIKRKITAGILIVTCFINTGCMGSIRGDNYISDDLETETERTLTQEQIDLLCGISVNEDKVKDGKLNSWQKEVLNQYDCAMEYLEYKYPSYDFVIKFCEPKNIVNSFTTFMFLEKNEDAVDDEDNEEKEYYYMYIDVYEENGKNRYEIADNFYGKIFEDELADRLFTLMEEEFTECINVTTSITTVEGEEFGEDLDIERVLSGELMMYHYTDFYINADGMMQSEYSDKVIEIKEFILEKGIYGSYDVKFVSEFEPEEVLYMEHFFGEYEEKCE